VTPDERTEAEVRADRALRRGELSTALELYTAIAAAFPNDELVAQKLKRIRENLQPMELSHAKTRVPIDQAPPPTNSIQSAEALAARGDYAGAIALYRKALEKRPDSDLIRERLAELFQIAQAMAPKAAAPGAAVPPAASSPPAHPLTRSPGDRPPDDRRPAPPPDGAAHSTPAHPLTRSPGDRPLDDRRAAPPPDGAAHSTPAHPLTRSPGDPGSRGVGASSASQGPVSTARLLSDLLDQISRRRRSPPPTG